MKKVVGIFITMVLVFVVVSMTLAEQNPLNIEWEEVKEMIDNWIKTQRNENYICGYIDGNIYYAAGVISNDEFKKLTGEDFTTEGLETLYLECEKYGENYDVLYANVKTVGFYEGYNVYELDMKTNNIPLGRHEGMNYYHVNVVFMVSK